ncbi:MAG: hypothetical protein U5N26_07545 [Candidatus Marinimicrobia bacterium]|nr:hypothetical protein [Candidatus Neomarinimicrobiota bacterium]
MTDIFFSILKQIPYEKRQQDTPRLEKAPRKGRGTAGPFCPSTSPCISEGILVFPWVNLILQPLAVECVKAYPVKADIHRRSFPHFFADRGAGPERNI